MSAIITGYETARALALHGAHVVFACRNMKATKEAMDKIRTENPKVEIDAMMIDLSCLKTVEQFAENYMNKNWLVHCLFILHQFDD